MPTRAYADKRAAQNSPRSAAQNSPRSGSRQGAAAPLDDDNALLFSYAAVLRAATTEADAAAAAAAAEAEAAAEAAAVAAAQVAHVTRGAAAPCRSLADIATGPSAADQGRLPADGREFPSAWYTSAFAIIRKKVGHDRRLPKNPTDPACLPCVAWAPSWHFDFINACGYFGEGTTAAQNAVGRRVLGYAHDGIAILNYIEMIDAFKSILRHKHGLWCHFCGE